MPLPRETTWRPIDPLRDKFPTWNVDDTDRASASDETLYYWRETFWNRHAAR